MGSAEQRDSGDIRCVIAQEIPLALRRWHATPVHAEIPECQVKQLHRRLVRGEGTSGLDDPAQPRCRLSMALVA